MHNTEHVRVQQSPTAGAPARAPAPQHKPAKTGQVNSLSIAYARLVTGEVAVSNDEIRIALRNPVLDLLGRAGAIAVGILAINPLQQDRSKCRNLKIIEAKSGSALASGTA